MTRDESDFMRGWSEQASICTRHGVMLEDTARRCIALVNIICGTSQFSRGQIAALLAGWGL